MRGNQTTHTFPAWGWRIVDALPVIIPTALAVFGTVSIIFLLAGQFRSEYIWPVGLVAAIAASFAIYLHYPKVANDNYRNWINILVIIGVLVWGGFNIRYTSQHVLVDRDPALYANAGIWLTNHDTLQIPTLHTFGNVPGVRVDNGTGFKPISGGDQKHVYAQGLHLLPAFIGLTGRIFGIAKALHINVIFGMSALLSIYALGRELIKRSWWAAVATGAVAASMPFLYFARDSYSEPLAATFTFGGLALLGLALKSERLSLWFLAGIVAGAGTLTRIDGYLTVAEMLAFLVVFLIITSKKSRLQAIANSATFIFGMGITSILGWLDASKLATPYYNDLHTQFYREMLAIAAVIILGCMAVLLAWKTRLLKRINMMTANWRGESTAILVLLFMLFLASRPLWFHPINTLGQRTMAELAIYWIPWYLGWSMAILGAVGITCASYRVMQKKNLIMTASLLVVIGTSLVYLTNPTVAGDQIWASRRLMPVILPGVAIFGAVTLDWLTDYFMLRRQRIYYAFAVIVSIAIVLLPLITSKPVIRLRPFTEISGLKSMCMVLPQNAAVLWLGDLADQRIVQPTRDICNIPSQGYNLPSSNISLKVDLIEIAKNAVANHKTPVVGIYSNNTSILPHEISSQLSTASTFTYNDLEHTYLHPPEASIAETVSIKMGIIQPDGSIEPLSQ